MAEKISSFEAHLNEKGGLKAFFADGINYQDFSNGIISKRTMVVEDNNELREKIIEYFKKSGLTTFCAQDYKTALRLIYPRFESASRFKYAIIDDIFPEERGKTTENLAGKVVDELLKQHPNVRIFGYVENDANIDKSKYVEVLRKDSASLDELYDKVIADAETIRKEKKWKYQI